MREAIERTVGISASRLGKHIDKVADDFQKEVNAAQRKEKRNQGLLDERDRKAKRELEHEAEIRGYDAEIKELSTEAKRMSLGQMVCKRLRRRSSSFARCVIHFRNAHWRTRQP